MTMFSPGDPFKSAEFKIVREVLMPARNGREGYSLGRFYFNAGQDDPKIFTIEDEDRYLEEGHAKIYSTSAIPLGRYELELYNSPKFGWVPLFKDVPGFSYIEIHGANNAEQLLGCIAVGEHRTIDGVAGCRGVLALIVATMRAAKAGGRKVFCTIERAK